jgi:phenylpropionate dioxygenase-like ring-hydroxylating dioxygenase large terminal subunit
MVEDPLLRDDWYPVARAETMTLRVVRVVCLLEEGLVICRGQDGAHRHRNGA